jgi:ferredoxin
MLVIDPEECIDCSLCEPECPAEAIVSADDLVPEMARFAALNTELATQWPIITVPGEVPPDAEHWQNISNKIEHLETQENRP